MSSEQMNTLHIMLFGAFVGGVVTLADVLLHGLGPSATRPRSSLGNLLPILVFLISSIIIFFRFSFWLSAVYALSYSGAVVLTAYLLVRFENIWKKRQ